MRYIVKLKNRTFEVDVEAGEAVLLNELEDGKPVPHAPVLTEKPVPKQPAQSEKPETKQTGPAPGAIEKPASTAKPSGSGETVRAPMPGMITGILVSEGQTVTDGDTLMILEAMKMENEIVATCSGTVSRLYISKGQVVQTDDPLAVIR